MINHTTRFRSTAVLLFASGLALAQTAPTTGTWRRAGDPPPATDPSAPAVPPAAPSAPTMDPSQPVQQTDAYGQPITVPAPPPDLPPQDVAPPPPPQSAPATSRPAYGLPAQLTVKPGTYATIRVNELLQSNKNKAGDLFTGTLAQPIVVDGVVVAVRGSAIVGTVAEAGKDKDGVHRLRLELTGITLADGTQAPLQSKLVTTQGRTTPGGVQAGTVVGTTAVGAGIGAAAGWGTGAAIGAGAGAAVGLVGVLATRNHPSVVYPESMLTFQISEPLLVSTATAPGAFRFGGPQDYARPQTTQVLRTGPPRPVAPYPYYYPYGYGPYYGGGYYPYGWGPGFGVVIGRGWGRR